MATDKPMQLGVVGLGRMGANIVRRLMRDGHICVVFDVSAGRVKTLVKEGASGRQRTRTLDSRHEQNARVSGVSP